MVPPISGNQLIVYKQTVSVIASQLELDSSILVSLVNSRPTGRKLIYRHAVERCTVFPGIVYGRLYSSLKEFSGKITSIIIFALKTVLRKTVIRINLLGHILIKKAVRQQFYLSAALQLNHTVIERHYRIRGDKSASPSCGNNIGIRPDYQCSTVPVRQRTVIIFQ